MAFDIFRRRQVGSDWSCNIGSEAPQGDGGGKSKIAMLMTVGILGVGVFVLANQPSGQEIQRQHYERERKARGHGI